MRQAESFAGQKFGSAYFFKLVQDAGGIGVVNQEQFDDRLQFLLYQSGFF